MNQHPIGKVFASDFRIDEFVTYGGMGIVYRGTQLSLNRKVCIKVPKHPGDPILRAYFDQEAQRLSQCRHPNVVEVYAAAKSGEEPFIAMEWLDWPTLDRLISAGRPFSPLQALKVIQLLLRALDHIYANTQILHRDIKPLNVFCSEDSLKLADFGLAKVYAQDAAGAGASTCGIGTPSYMAPEIFFGPPHVGSDLYSLGCTLFEMLSHHHAFPGNGCLSRADWAEHHRVHQPALPTDAVTYPVLLLDFLKKLLEPNPAHRYQTHEQCLHDLEALTDELEDREPDVVWYLTRNEATQDMCERWCYYEYITLVGVSHKHLHEYIGSTLKRKKELPWRRLVVYFADDHSGQAWEKAAFPHNLRAKRQAVTSELMRLEAVPYLRAFESVDFYQREEPSGWTGSLLEAAAADNQRAAYVVLSNVPHSSDLKEAVTFRLGSKSLPKTRHAQLLDNIVDQFRRVAEVSVSLGSFHRNVWDFSANDWDHYCRHGHAYQESLHEMLRVAEVSPRDEVLDVGCGTGFLAAELLRKNPSELRLTLLDSSPNMISKAKENLRHISIDHIGYALCPVLGAQERAHIDLVVPGQTHKRKFNKLFLHFMLPSLCRPEDDLDEVVNWCRPYLKPGGHLIISARNTSVELPPPPQWTDWQDGLRPALEAAFRAVSGGERLLRSTTKTPVLTTIEAVSSAFARGGFLQRRHWVAHHPMHPEERRLMWLCPAVIDSLVDVFALGIPKAKEIVAKTFGQLHLKKTFPMSVAYWAFRMD